MGHARSTSAAATTVRVTAIASLTPLEELDADPFLVDSRSQYAMCARWAAERGYVVTRELLVRGLRPDHRTLWADVEAGLVDLFVAPSHRVLERALASVDAFTAACRCRPRATTAAEGDTGGRSTVVTGWERASHTGRAGT
jgi:hypothetical protein